MDSTLSATEIEAARRRYEVARITAALTALLEALARRGRGADEQDVWAAAAVHWTGVLTREQRVSLLAAAIDACAPDDAAEILEAELRRMTQGPLPPFGTVKDEARDWAFFAPNVVLKTYLVACFRALPRKDRIAALPALQRFALK